jgi:hypothetical protein
MRMPQHGCPSLMSVRLKENMIAVETAAIGGECQRRRVPNLDGPLPLGAQSISGSD